MDFATISMYNLVVWSEFEPTPRFRRIGRAGFPFKRSFRSPSWLYAALREIHGSVTLNDWNHVRTPHTFAARILQRFSSNLQGETKHRDRFEAKLGQNCVERIRESCVKYQRLSIDRSYFQILANTFHNFPCNFLIVFITTNSRYLYVVHCPFKTKSDNDLRR